MSKYFDFIALFLLIIGGFNWGSIGLFDFNFVTYFFGGTFFTMAIYVLVGLSALWKVLSYFGLNKYCGC